MAEPGAAKRRTPVPVSEVRIESVGVNTLDQRRVDVAVDLTPCHQPLTIELVIVGTGDDELSSVLLLDSHDWTLDRVLHLKQDAELGEYTLHVGVFSENLLVTRASRKFEFPSPKRASGRGESGR